ncbi:M1 family metallopeptidase [Streptomyces lichenis]|uniref:Aminopeptidase N n=1 Tax=Streptomyces lichenis TaxID=2306967 RepID=A0ABT0I3H4_9ACTN|nr:M1 family metallopeptidase [Streptomyces lichenis]MCK8675870.1 M1 family metallopeptidase [Streptomyces lichenis]
MSLTPPFRARRGTPSASRTPRSPRTSRLTRVALAVLASGGLLAAAAPAPEPLGIGDPLFPHLGNPGYDVLAYDLAFTYGGDNTKPLPAVTTVDARVTDRLERINLDYTHGTVRSVAVDGRPAAFVRSGEDLVVDPDRVLEAGDRVRITVAHSSDPTGPRGAGGWVRTVDGLAMANQADAARRVFPSNDHPSDKAPFTFHVTAPKDLTVVANGRRIGSVLSGNTRTWLYRAAEPMATELAQVSIGRSAVLERIGPRGLPVRDVVPTADVPLMTPWLKRTPSHLEWMERKAGRYPFETYGVLIASADTGFQLETQTLSLFERSLFTESGLPDWYIESIMVHELAHHWFGNSVSPRRWADLWLNEGHATWYEMQWAEEEKGVAMTTRMRQAYAESDGWRTAGGPPAAPRPPAAGQQISLFRPVVYDGSALVLYALRQEIGTAAFERLERRWVTDHAHGTASTDDFVRLASEVAGRDLGGFLHGWLYGEKTPPMPGHPEWRAAAPVKAAQPGAGETAGAPGHPHHRTAPLAGKR